MEQSDSSRKEDSQEPEKRILQIPDPNRLNTTITVQAQQPSERIQREQQIFEIALKDDLFWSRLLLATAVLGNLLILIAVIVVLTGNITVALANSAIGLLLDGTAILVYKPRQDARKRLDDIHNQLIDADNFEAAMKLTNTLKGDTRDRVTEAIINKMINQRSQELQIADPYSQKQINSPTSTPKKKRGSKGKASTGNAANVLTQELKNEIEHTQMDNSSGPNPPDPEPGPD